MENQAPPPMDWETPDLFSPVDVEADANAEAHASHTKPFNTYQATDAQFQPWLYHVDPDLLRSAIATANNLSVSPPQSLSYAGRHPPAVMPQRTSQVSSSAGGQDSPSSLTISPTQVTRSSNSSSGLDLPQYLTITNVLRGSTCRTTAGRIEPSLMSLGEGHHVAVGSSSHHVDPVAGRYDSDDESFDDEGDDDVREGNADSDLINEEEDTEDHDKDINITARSKAKGKAKAKVTTKIKVTAKSKGSTRLNTGSAASSSTAQPQARERNRLAATKCRKKQRNAASELSDRHDRLEAQNQQLTLDVADLRRETYALKEMVMQHAGCDSQLIQRYFDNAAREWVEQIEYERNDERK